MRRLVEGAFGLAPRLAARIEARSGGNPAFAVALVRDASARGSLVQTAAGLDLVPGTEDTLPRTFTEALAGRLTPLLLFGEAPFYGLEVAAALGQHVDSREWANTCREAVVPASDELLAEGVRVGVLVPDVWGLSHGFSFASPAMRELVEARATAGGRAAAWHRACAAAIRQHARMFDPRRLAHHLLAAGEPEEALPWLRRAIRTELDGGDRRLADGMLDHLAAALDAAEIPEADPQRIDGDVMRAAVRRILGDPHGARDAAERAHRGARAAGRARDEIRASAELAEAERLLGNLATAEQLLLATEPLLADADPGSRGLVAQRLGTVAFERGDSTRMMACADVARAAFIEADDRVSAATALNLRGCALASNGRMEDAMATFAAAEREQAAVGCRWGAADAANNVGFALYELGRTEEAAAAFTRSIAMWDRVGSPLDAHPHLGLALIHLERGRWGDAEHHAEGALRSARRLGWGPNASAQALASLYAARAGRRDPGARALREELEGVLARAEAVDPIVFRIRAIGDSA
jgi:tetratricopeptide (TPR) repeat protein